MKEEIFSKYKPKNDHRHVRLRTPTHPLTHIYVHKILKRIWHTIIEMRGCFFFYGRRFRTDFPGFHSYFIFSLVSVCKRETTAHAQRDGMRFPKNPTVKEYFLFIFYAKLQIFCRNLYFNYRKTNTERKCRPQN